MLISCLTVTQPGRLKELECSIRCFGRQNYGDREMVIVHDSDTDFERALRGLVARFPEERFHISRLAPGKTLGELRNHSVHIARGELICQWDDDDLYHPQRLSAQYERLKETDSEFCFLTDQLHWFRDTGEFFWDDWNVERYPMNLIQGTLMGRRDRMPLYATLPRGEDTPVLIQLFRDGASLTGLGGQAYLYIYTFSGKNAWGMSHHAAISQWKRLRRESLELRRDLLQRELPLFELPLHEARFPHDEGELVIPLSGSQPLS